MRFPSQFILPLFLSFLPVAGSAATFTWKGTSSGNWQTNSNWNTAPSANLTDDALIFPATGINQNMNNDRASPVALNKMTFSSPGYSVTGSRINLSSTLGTTPLIAATHNTGSTLIRAELHLTQNSTFSTVAGGTLTFTPPPSPPVINTPVALDGFVLTLTANGLIQMNTSITGTGTSGVTITGTGGVRFLADQSFEGNVLLNGGTLTVNAGMNSLSAVRIAAAGTLMGIGATGAVFCSGKLSPGDAGPGKLSINGTTTFQNVTTSRLVMELGSASNPGLTYDQIACQSVVTINANASLELTPLAGFNPADGEVYTLLNKAGSVAIVGTFLGMPQGSLVKVGSKFLRLNYTGGTGNDLTATVVAPELKVNAFNAVPVPGGGTGRRITASVSGGVLAAGATVVWQVSSAVSDWTTLASGMADASGNVSFDVVDTIGGPKRFYRAVIP